MEEKNPLVSICIPTFNRAHSVWRTIESSIHQTYKNIEIIVVDNASTDDTREVVMKYAKRDPRVKYFRNETNIGSGNNFLKCAEYASGFYMQALGSDDWLSRNYVEEGVKSFALNPDAAAIITNIVTFELNDENGRLEFSDEVLMSPGKYSADWFFRNIYLGKAGGAGFISFLRREDSIIGLKKVLDNPVNMFQRGERREPFDMPIFLEILAKYPGIFVTKKAAYVKTVHGKDHVGLEGESFETREGQLRYAIALRRAYEFFYGSHGFEKHRNRLRFFGGLTIVSNAVLTFFSSRLERTDTSGYFEKVKEYFKDYSKKEKWLIMVSILPYAVLKIIERFSGTLRRKKHFSPDSNYFLTEEFAFKAD